MKGKKEAPRTGGNFDPQRYTKGILTVNEVMDLKDVFDMFDSDGSGEVDLKELKSGLLSLGMETSSQTLMDMMEQIDKDDSHSVDFGEFVQMMTASLTQKPSREDLFKVYKLFLGDDQKTTGFDARHLRAVADELNIPIKEDELKNMVFKSDENMDGKVSFEEFYNIMTSVDWQ